MAVVVVVGKVLFCGSVPLVPTLAALSSVLAAPGATVTPMRITAVVAVPSGLMVLLHVTLWPAVEHVNGVAAVTLLMVRPSGMLSNICTVFVPLAAPPVLLITSVNVKLSPTLCDCGLGCDLDIRISGADCTVFKSVAQPAGLPFPLQV